MATITFLGDFFDKSFNYNRRIGLYTGPASYVTGGDPIPPEQLRLGKLEHMDLAFANDGAGNLRIVIWNRTSKTLQWFTAIGSEVAGGTNLTAFTVDFEAVGK